MSDIRRKTVEGLKPGDTFSVSRTFSERDVIRFADISRDYNPVHFDERGRSNAEAMFTNIDGVTVLEAVITGIVPDDPERRIMNDMLREGDPTNRVDR